MDEPWMEEMDEAALRAAFVPVVAPAAGVGSTAYRLREMLEAGDITPGEYAEACAGLDVPAAAGGAADGGAA